MKVINKKFFWDLKIVVAPEAMPQISIPLFSITEEWVIYSPVVENLACGHEIL